MLLLLSLLALASDPDPADVDTDGDGMSDAQELRRRLRPTDNGLLEFPEPMVFDMVRGFGAKQGELEANVLAQLVVPNAELEWAPEFEVAVVDDFALEVEIGFINHRLEALKLAAQGTLGIYLDGDFAHGLQLIVEAGVVDWDLELSPLYMAGVRLAPRWTWVSLVGALLVFPTQGGPVHAGPLVNTSLFMAPSQRVVLGIENNFSWLQGTWELRVMPQVHATLHAHFELQAGAGLLLVDGAAYAEISVRPVATF